MDLVGKVSRRPTCSSFSSQCAGDLRPDVKQVINTECAATWRSSGMTVEESWHTLNLFLFSWSRADGAGTPLNACAKLFKLHFPRAKLTIPAKTGVTVPLLNERELYSSQESGNKQ